MPELLFHREHSDSGEPLVILHGLFGSSKNWFSLAEKLAAKYHVYTVDLRNHGESFHADSHAPLELATDLHNWLAAQNLKNVHLLGHSMGGITAMLFALHWPQLVQSLVVIDISPRAYEVDYSKEFAALSIDLSQLKSRQEIDAAMAEHIDDLGLRQFLATNIGRNENGYFWRVNVATLKKEREMGSVDFVAENKTYDGPTLFLRGGASKFMTDDDSDIIKKHFPRAEISIIEGAGHWLHHSHGPAFLQEVQSFLP